MKLKMEGSLGYKFSAPFEHFDVIKIKVKWKRLSSYSTENKDKNLTRYFDALREAIQQTIHQLKDIRVTSIVTWGYEGFMPEYVLKKLKQIDGTISPELKKGIVTWGTFLESSNLKDGE